MENILAELAKPFHPSHITWKPGVFNRDKTKALGLAYADLRAYQNRLDEVIGLNWSVTYTPWGDRLVCHLTIDGVTRSSTGEPDGQSERSEIAGTAAEAQAFKRACAMFGLGRYLYNLPTIWAEFDADRRQFTDQGKAMLNGVIVQHYRRHVDPAAELGELSGNGYQMPPSAILLSEFNRLGRDVYGDQWEHVRRRNVERISNGIAASDDELSKEQLQKLIDGLKKLKRQRTAA